MTEGEKQREQRSGQSRHVGCLFDHMAVFLMRAEAKREKTQ